MNIGTAIRTVRVQKGLKQVALAEQLGISVTSLSQIENGATQPSQKTISAICDAFEISEPFLYILAIEEKDVPVERKDAYSLLYPALKDLATKLLTNENGISNKS